jgi:hypothetical protein
MTFLYCFYRVVILSIILFLCYQGGISCYLFDALRWIRCCTLSGCSMPHFIQRSTICYRGKLAGRARIYAHFARSCICIKCGFLLRCACQGIAAHVDPLLEDTGIIRDVQRTGLLLFTWGDANTSPKVFCVLIIIKTALEYLTVYCMRSTPFSSFRCFYLRFRMCHCKKSMVWMVSYRITLPMCAVV